MKHAFVLLAFLIASVSTARAADFGITLDPVIGYERDQKLLPRKHTSDRLTYGARLTVGLLLLSAEFEYTRAYDEETFTDLGMSTKDTTQKAKIGLRSGIGGAVLRWSLRAGVQAKSNLHEQTSGGVTTTTQESIRYSPYGGTGLRIRLGGKFWFYWDVVAVFHQFPDMNENEYQTVAGFSVRLP